MGKEWIDDQTTLNSVAPEILEQEERIAQQRQLISQLNASGNRNLANEAREVLRNMCDSLTAMRLEERAAKIELREQAFRRVSEEEAMERVMKDCPL